MKKQHCLPESTVCMCMSFVLIVAFFLPARSSTYSAEVGTWWNFSSVNDVKSIHNASVRYINRSVHSLEVWMFYFITSIPIHSLYGARMLLSNRQNAHNNT